MCIRACCVCQTILGNNGCSCNQITHTYCQSCLKEVLAQVEELENELSGNQQYAQIQSVYSDSQKPCIDSRNNNLAELR